MKKSVTVALSGLNVVDSPGPGISVARALKESPDFDVKIIGLAYEVMEPGIYMRNEIDKTYQVPFPSKGHEVLLERIKEIHAKESIDLIIPNFDAELMPYIKMQKKLADLGIATFLPTEEQFDARLKGNLQDFGQKYGISVPKSVAAFGVEDMLRKIDNYTQYPVMVKGKFYEAYIAHSREQAVYYYNKLAAKWGTPIILQQYVKGREYNVCALGDGKGTLIGAVPMRKTYITDTGKGWAGITIKDDDLVEMARHMIEQTQWRGGLELELIKDERENVYLIEINPRFPAWVYLTVGAGQNQPADMLKLALGYETEPRTHFEVGKMFIRYSYDMIVDLQDFAQFSSTGEL